MEDRRQRPERVRGAVADYWLGAGSSGDRVVTKHATDTVLDEGADNAIVGPAQQAANSAARVGRVTERIARWGD